MPKAVPQPPQNFTPGSFEKPHEGQARANEDPHSEQNRRPLLLPVPQRGQVIFSAPSRTVPGLFAPGGVSAATRDDAPVPSELRPHPTPRVPSLAGPPPHSEHTVSQPQRRVWKTVQRDGSTPACSLPGGRTTGRLAEHVAQLIRSEKVVRGWFVDTRRHRDA